MDQHADYLLLREPVPVEPGSVRAAGADAGRGGLCGCGGAGVDVEG